MPVTAFVWARCWPADLAPYFFVTCFTLLPSLSLYNAFARASRRDFVATVPVALGWAGHTAQPKLAWRNMPDIR